jgi:hypothetical protein
LYCFYRRRIDFRDLVRDLFALYKTRIWMAQIDSSFEPNLDATVSLMTGDYPPHDQNHSHSSLGSASYGAMAHHHHSSSSLNPNAAYYVAPALLPLDANTDAQNEPWIYSSENF